MTDSQRKAAADAAEDTLARIQNFAAGTRSDAIRSGAERAAPATMAGASASPTPQSLPAADSTFTFSQDQLNALFTKWSDAYGWRDVYQRYLTDPVVILQDGRIIFAGKVKWRDLDTVVSVHFAPRIDAQGRLDLNLVNVLGGRLPLPSGMLLDPARQRLTEVARTHLPVWQQRAAIDAAGGANHDAMLAAMTKLGVRALNGQPSPAVLFVQLVGSKRQVPVKLTGIHVVDGSLSLGVVPLTAEQRARLVEQIREPLGSPPAEPAPSR
jgi:hypothetical protein